MKGKARTPDLYLSIVEHFDAAHFLPRYRGPCRRMHGHTWQVKVTVTPEPDLIIKDGMLIDFKDLKKIVRTALPDHRLINTFRPFFKANPPTAENVALYLAETLRRKLHVKKLLLSEIEVWESEKASAKLVCPILFYENS